MAESSVAASLEAAAELLERDGWTQRAYGAPGYPHCVAGAIRLVPGNGEAARKALRQRLGVLNLALWNDAPGRTQREVIAGLRTTATKLREKS